MATDNVLQVIIKAIDEATGPLTKTGLALQQLEQTTTKTGLATKSLTSELRTQLAAALARAEELFGKNTVAFKEFEKGLRSGVASGVRDLTRLEQATVQQERSVVRLGPAFGVARTGLSQLTVAVAQANPAYGSLISQLDNLIISFSLMASRAPTWGAAFAAIAGPVGITVAAITVLTAGISAYIDNLNKARESAEKFRAAHAQIAAEAAKLGFPPATPAPGTALIPGPPVRDLIRQAEIDFQQRLKDIRRREQKAREEEILTPARQITERFAQERVLAEQDFANAVRKIEIQRSDETAKRRAGLAMQEAEFAKAEIEFKREAGRTFEDVESDIRAALELRIGAITRARDADLLAAQGAQARADIQKKAAFDIAVAQRDTREEIFQLDTKLLELGQRAFASAVQRAQAQAQTEFQVIDAHKLFIQQLSLELDISLRAAKTDEERAVAFQLNADRMATAQNEVNKKLEKFRDLMLRTPEQAALVGSERVEAADIQRAPVELQQFGEQARATGERMGRETAEGYAQSFADNVVDLLRGAKIQDVLARQGESILKGLLASGFTALFPTADLAKQIEQGLLQGRTPEEIAKTLQSPLNAIFTELFQGENGIFNTVTRLLSQLGNLFIGQQGGGGLLGILGSLAGILGGLFGGAPALGTTGGTAVVPGGALDPSKFRLLAGAHGGIVHGFEPLMNLSRAQVAALTPRAQPMLNVPMAAIRKFQSGGLITKPTLGIVGEGGEPELITPLSKISKMEPTREKPITIVIEGDVVPRIPTMNPKDVIRIVSSDMDRGGEISRATQLVIKRNR